MTALASPVVAPPAPRGALRVIGRANPVTRLAAAVVVTAPLIVTLDWLVSLVCLGLSLVLLIAAGAKPAGILRSVWPLLVAAPLGGVGMLLYGTPSGREYWSFWLAHITDGSISLALAVAVRALAIGIPTIVMFRDVDATALADGLAQRVHLPARFVLGTLAALRLVGLMIQDWQAMGLARRARGLGDGAAVRRATTMAFGLLVLALRRGSKLATAMEARGFGAPIRRSWARPAVLGAPDLLVVLVAAAIGTAGLAVSASVGQLHWVWS